MPTGDALLTAVLSRAWNSLELAVLDSLYDGAEESTRRPMPLPALLDTQPDAHPSTSGRPWAAAAAEAPANTYGAFTDEDRVASIIGAPPSFAAHPYVAWIYMRHINRHEEGVSTELCSRVQALWEKVSRLACRAALVRPSRSTPMRVDLVPLAHQPLHNGAQ